MIINISSLPFEGIINAVQDFFRLCLASLFLVIGSGS